MVSFLADLSTAFVLGLLTPLTAACVLPLYPGFLAYLSGQMSGKNNRKLIAFFGLAVTSGVISFMLILGIVFTTLLQVSLTKVIGIVSPLAFGMLAVISILLIFNINVGKFLPQTRLPAVKNPVVNAFVFGFFFGAIVVPCNPLFIAALFTRTIIAAGFFGSILKFLFFGIGIGFPLLLFSLISTASSNGIIRLLTDHRRKINLAAGLVMLAVSLYYLAFVFRIFG